jgi:hypothetical protein
VGTTAVGRQGLGYNEAKKLSERDKILQEMRNEAKTRERHMQLHRRRKEHGLTGMKWESPSCHGRSYGGKTNIL